MEIRHFYNPKLIFILQCIFLNFSPEFARDVDSDEDNAEQEEKHEDTQRDERDRHRRRESESSRHYSRRSDYRDSDRHRRFEIIFRIF